MLNSSTGRHVRYLQAPLAKKISHMKLKLVSPLGLNPTGVGPKIFKYTVPFLLAGIIGKILMPEFSTLPLSDRINFFFPGLVWMIGGVIIYILAARKLIIEFPKGSLITTGVFALSRNPLYASWVVFIIPGLAMVSDNWIFLISALVMYLLTLRYVVDEEEKLLEIFGDEYIDYIRRVPRIGFYVKSLKR